MISSSVLGVGLGYRAPLHDKILEERDHIDFLEAISDQFLFAPPEKMDRLMEIGRSIPVIPHSLSFSVGTAETINSTYLSKNASFVRAVDPPWFSDHLCMTKVAHVDLGSLTPLWFTEEVVETVVRNVKTIRQEIPSPQFLLENITYYVPLPGSELTEAEFITEVLDKTDSGLLLDVNNVFVNSRNLGYDPYQFLSEIPLDRVVQVHIAGYVEEEGLTIDTHDCAVSDDVWDILKYVVKNSPVKGISLERDSQYPEFPVMLEELDHARRILTLR